MKLFNVGSVPIIFYVNHGPLSLSLLASKTTIASINAFGAMLNLVWSSNVVDVFNAYSSNKMWTPNYGLSAKYIT